MTRELRPVGAATRVPTRARFVAASNTDLEAAVRAGQFRADLYHAIAAMTLTIPPLRERPREILPLANLFAQYAWGQSGNSGRLGFSAQARAVLAWHRWPGNVRELRDVVERAVPSCQGHIIHARHLRFEDGR